MDISQKLIRRYKVLVFPKNRYWLDCNFYWDTNFCRCLDEFELNVGILIFEYFIKENPNLVFDFSYYNSYYSMKIYDKNTNICIPSKCAFCQEMQLAQINDGLSEDNFNGGDEFKKIMTIGDESIVACIAMCLYNINCNHHKERDLVFKILFSLNPYIFLKYLSSLKQYISKASNLENSFLERHLVLIDEMLDLYAQKDSISDLVEESLNIIDNKFFIENYCCSKVKLRAKQMFNDVFLSKFKEPNKLGLIMPFNPKCTIVNQVLDIIKIIKQKKNVSCYKNTFENICDSFDKILTKQKCRGEDPYKTDIIKLQEFISKCK